VLLSTLVVCVLLYEFLLRRFALLRAAFGIKTGNGVRPHFRQLGSDPIS